MANNDSAFRALYSKLTTALRRTGVKVGETAGYPRIEIHTITEGERLDKDGALRKLSCTIESMTTDGLLNAHMLNDENISKINGLAGQSSHDYRIDGIIPSQLQEITDTADSKEIIYRLLQGVDIYLTRTGDDTPEPETENN